MVVGICVGETSLSEVTFISDKMPKVGEYVTIEYDGKKVLGMIENLIRGNDALNIDINDSYKAYLLEKYEETYYSENLINAGRAVYVKRNYEMIDNSDFCVCYYNGDYQPKKRKSGAGIAFAYAVKRKKIIINTAEIIANV